MNRWIAEVDTYTRMWKCPECGGRLVGEPIRWNPDFNPFFYCPYCGEHLMDSSQESLFDDELYKATNCLPERS